MTKPKSDLLTLIALSAFSFILATALHEHGGHALACALVGGNIKELGAFYVDCDPATISGMANRFVAFAGPLISLITGIIGMYFLNRTSKTNSQLKYFLWHFGTVNLMTATGYLLFSGISGLGDFGTGESGMFFQAQPEWLYRVILTVLGLGSYLWVILVSLRKMDSFIGGEGMERVNRAQMLSLASYLTGGIVSVLIGLLNPYGIIIVLISSFASSMGGTSGLAWMMQLLDRKKTTGDEPFVMQRSWAWIGGSIAFLVIYAIMFGPTIYL
ncbi:MAG: hypothetical protein AABZ00_10305 [Chloroflexota bacterium]